jgi:hypothetical protein
MTDIVARNGPHDTNVLAFVCSRAGLLRDAALSWR